LLISCRRYCVLIPLGAPLWGASKKLCEEKRYGSDRRVEFPSTISRVEESAPQAVAAKRQRTFENERPLALPLEFMQNQSR